VYKVAIEILPPILDVVSNPKLSEEDMVDGRDLQWVQDKATEDGQNAYIYIFSV
jgi:hypothetical protein